jgi:hypothetical protein
MPEWTMYAAALASFAGALFVGFAVSRKSVRAGDGWLTERLKSAWWGGVTMIATMTSFILLANLVNWLRG